MPNGECVRASIAASMRCMWHDFGARLIFIINSWMLVIENHTDENHAMFNVYAPLQMKIH